jgi:hypothetical protein
MEHYAEFMLNELIGMAGLDAQETAKVLAQIEEFRAYALTGRRLLWLR